MMTRVEQIVAIHVLEHLLEHGSLQDLAEDGQDGHRPVVLCVKFSPLSLVQWHYLSNFPLGGELLILNGKG